MPEAPEMLSYATRSAPPAEYRRAAIVLLIWGGIAAPTGFLAIPLLLLMPAMGGSVWDWLIGLLTVLPFLAVLLLWGGFGVNALRAGFRLLRGHDADIDGAVGMNTVAVLLTLIADSTLAWIFFATQPWTWGDWSQFLWFTLAVLIMTGILIGLAVSLRILRKCQRMQQFE